VFFTVRVSVDQINFSMFGSLKTDQVGKPLEKRQLSTGLKFGGRDLRTLNC
jgi:hypothetical protein